MSSEYHSVIEISQKIAQETPDRTLFTFIDDAGKVVSTFTCKEVLNRAQQISHHLLHTYELKRGDRVLLVYPPGLEFVEAFLACLLVGIIPVPVPPPIPLRPDVGLPGFVKIASDCEARAQLTCQSYSLTRTFGRILQALKSGPKWPDLPWIITDKLEASSGSFEPISPKLTDLAFLQYTSGSTRAPRGVSITHGNISAQIQLLQNELKMDSSCTTVFWMPHYHDFALIGGIINALCGNNQLILFSATGFLRRPALWVELMDRYHATHTGSPDFGYRLVTSKTTTEDRAKLDLSSLCVVMSAAEPIRTKTVDEFLRAFEVSKLDPFAFSPSYGLAEHSLAVTVGGRKRFMVRDAERFGCGKPSPGVTVKIVEPTLCVSLPDGEIGEIWIDSKNKAQGYFGRIEETKLKFEASLKNSDQRWLRTGDLGVILEEELVVVGRLDDMIILRGRNLYPQDAEEMISEGDVRVRTGRVLAFGISGEESELLIMIELKDGFENETDMTNVAQTARILLQQEMGIPQAVLIFVPQGTIPKTSSGKLQRNKCREDWIAGRLKSLRVDRGLG